jgi:hypothetical protein
MYSVILVARVMRMCLVVAGLAAACILQMGGGIHTAGRANRHKTQPANYPLFPVKIVVPYPAG